MHKLSEELIRFSGYSREGFADTYDANRLAPPSDLLDVLTLFARTERPELVVDLGSGTGLSTRVWADRAEQAVGIEPNPAMRAEAEARTQEWNVRYVDAYAGATGLPDESADIVTCSQSFHWMEPEPTLAEAARILRPGGVFAAYDYEVPPVIHPDVDAAFERWLIRRRELRQQFGMPISQKGEHLKRIKASGAFTSAREIVLHGYVEGGAARVVGLARSIGPPLEEAEPQLKELAAVAERVLSDRVVSWLVPYRVRIGVV
jgi:ubiquinone/menaquinone biosynthesis C-methylase UbiE